MAIQTRHEGEITRPQNNLASIGAVGEQSRSFAEIQSALAIAASRPRDEKHCIAKIKNACQRQGLAESAEYCYSRGGTEIIGPTIDLLEVIANCWGNIQFGFREVAQRRGESEVESFAWDLESNTKRVVVFTVPHRRHTKEGSYELGDPRDIYELVANNAQRRTRACLEAIIPPDVVEDAVQECRRTLKAKAEVTPESLQALLEAFAPLGVVREQIEAKIQRSLESMQPAQLVSMRRMYKSIKDGMSTSEQWFGPKPETAASGGETATDDLKAKLKASIEKAKAENATEAQAGGPGDAQTGNSAPQHSETASGPLEASQGEQSGQDSPSASAENSQPTRPDGKQYDERDCKLDTWLADIHVATSSASLDSIEVSAKQFAPPELHTQISEAIAKRKTQVTKKNGKQ